MTFELLQKICILFVALFIIGTLLSLQIYKWDHSSFFKSTLWLKICFWIPIFVVFLILLYTGKPAYIAVTATVSILAIKELFWQKKVTTLGLFYLLVFLTMFAHLLGVDSANATITLLVVCFCSVLSDVHAYFFGTFFGAHKLPNFINPSKSWEGVGGQVIGAIVGYVLLAIASGVSLPAWPIALVIGIASAAGDLLNSIVKRSIGIKDWGQTIPGHGGFLDRFASLSFALAAAVWYMKLIR